MIFNIYLLNIIAIQLIRKFAIIIALVEVKVDSKMNCVYKKIPLKK